MASVMPVSTVMNGGIGAPGLTSVANSPSCSPPRTLTAPISVIPPPSGAPPGGLQVDHDERGLPQGERGGVAEASPAQPPAEVERALDVTRLVPRPAG